MSRLVARWLSLPPNLRGILWVGMSGFAVRAAERLHAHSGAASQFLRDGVPALFLRLAVPAADRVPAWASTARCTPGGLPLHLFRGAIHTCGHDAVVRRLAAHHPGRASRRWASPVRSSSPSARRCSWARTCGCGAGWPCWWVSRGAMIIIRPGFSALHLGVICILIIDADLLGLEPDLQGAGAHRFGQHHRDLAEHRDRGLRRARSRCGSGRRRTRTDLAVVRGGGSLRHARPSQPAARLPARRHHPAAADRLPVADLEHAAGLSSCSSSSPTSGPSSARR